jgi:amino acid transporter
MLRPGTTDPVPLPIAPVPTPDTMASILKRLLVGPPIATAEEAHTRLGRPVALTVFASDAISSTAYATEEILLVLMPVAGLAALDYLVPISIIVAILLTIVVFSYRQTIYAYPSGGGSYVVSRENLGVMAALVAGASLLVDYVLTVAVSVSAGIAAITSAFEGLHDYTVALCLGAIVVMMLLNLRGTKESGRIFAPPVYTYVVSLALLVLYGLYRVFIGGLEAMPLDQHTLNEIAANTEDGAFVVGSVTALLVMRAFSSGAVALTGVEAISNGVPAFKKPESHNAASTLIVMALILGSAFMGLSILASHIDPVVSEEETLLSIMARYVYGGETPLYYVLQFATFAILILAANTAFADFPRVSSIIAGDGFLPRQFANRGDRLVFSNGVIVLAAVAGLLIIAFGGETSALIPLYAVGVFTGFTLSQAGMVKHHAEERKPGWRRNQVINGIGSGATFIVLIVVVVSKFTSGAWIPVALIPLIVIFFRMISRHYTRVADGLEIPEGYRPRQHRHTVVVLVGRVNRGVIDALSYAESLRPDRLMAATVVTNDQETDHIFEEWEQHDIPIQLRVLHSPYRDLTGSVLRFLDELDEEWPDDIITVVVPEFVLDHWWEQALHNQSALLLRARLRDRPNTVIVAVPTHLSHPTIT